MPRTEGIFNDGTYYLKVTYDLENAADKEEFDDLMYETLACDSDELNRSLKYRDDRYAEVTTRLARQVYRHDECV